MEKLFLFVEGYVIARPEIPFQYFDRALGARTVGRTERHCRSAFQADSEPQVKTGLLTAAFLSFLLSRKKTQHNFDPKRVYLNPEQTGLRTRRHQAISEIRSLFV